jgi:PPP family 3-phenylpropionic acid transporter
MLPYWRLSAYYFFYFAFIGAFSPYFALYLQSLRFSATDIAVLMSMMQVMRIVAPALWGWLADRLGARMPIVRLAALCSLAGFAGLFLSEQFFWSAALPLVEGVTFDHLGANPGGYGRVRLWGSVGFIAVVLGLGYLLDHLPERAVLWVSALILGGILVCAWCVEDAPRGRHLEEAEGLRTVLRQPPVRFLFAACFLMSAAHGALYVFYSILLVGAGYDKATVGWMWTLGVVAEIGVFLAMPRLLRSVAERTILMFAFACAVLRFLLIGWGVESLALLVAAQLLHGVTFGAYHSAAIVAVNRWFPGRLQSRGQALYGSVSFGAGGMVGGVLSGLVWQSAGPAWTYTLASALALGGGWLVWASGPAAPEPALGGK